MFHGHAAGHGGGADLGAVRHLTSVARMKYVPFNTYSVMRLCQLVSSRVSAARRVGLRDAPGMATEFSPRSRPGVGWLTLDPDIADPPVSATKAYVRLENLARRSRPCQRPVGRCPRKIAAVLERLREDVALLVITAKRLEDYARSTRRSFGGRATGKDYRAKVREIARGRRGIWATPFARVQLRVSGPLQERCSPFPLHI